MSAAPVRPVDSATVILLRPAAAPDGFECFMVRRHAASDFAADVYVFPGGRVDAADHEVAPELTALPATASEADDLLIPFRVAAVREVFEEAGVLLALDRRDRLLQLTAPETRERFAGYRREVHAGRLALTDVAEREGLRLALDQLHPLSHWVTPGHFPRRFNTYFFVALAPQGQEPLHDTLETVASTWISPRRALDGYAAGSFPLVFATERNLMRLAAYDSPEAVVESAASPDLRPVEPRAIRRDGAEVFVIPGDPGYDER